MSFQYLLDANTYIQAKNLYYRMKTVPGFWDWLDNQMDSGAVGTVQPIVDELKQGSDPLAEWIGERQSSAVPVDDVETQEVFSEIVNYIARQPSFAEPHVSDFLDGADPWLIAKAKVEGATVVTHEIPVVAASKRVKIPNICKAFEVAYGNPYDLMDVLEARLVLA